MSENPIRIVLFEDNPNTLLVHADEGVSLELPECMAPFDKDTLAKAASKAGLEVRITVEPKAGRWSSSIRRRQSDQKAERKQKHKLQTETVALQQRLGDDPMLRDRARLIARKQEVDEQLRAAKIHMAKVKADVAEYQRFIPQKEYNALEQLIADLKSQSVGLQGQLGVIKETLVQRNIDGNNSINKRFVDLAKQILDEDEFAELIELAQYPELPDDD